MSAANAQAEWYYVGHYGQLGPLTLEQMTELAADGVITQETYVWRSGMSDWSLARNVTDLRPALGTPQSEVYPPAHLPAGPPPAPTATRSVSPLAPEPLSTYSVHSHSGWQYIQSHAPKSDKSKVAAGILNMFVPGVGRMYLGYMAHGILQLFVSVITCGVGTIWPFIDGIYILAGGVRLDGYGRRLED
jgi:hypothetical protein